MFKKELVPPESEAIKSYRAGFKKIADHVNYDLKKTLSYLHYRREL